MFCVQNDRGETLRLPDEDGEGVPIVSDVWVTRTLRWLGYLVAVHGDET